MAITTTTTTTKNFVFLVLQRNFLGFVILNGSEIVCLYFSVYLSNFAFIFVNRLCTDILEFGEICDWRVYFSCFVWNFGITKRKRERKKRARCGRLISLCGYIWRSLCFIYFVCVFFFIRCLWKAEKKETKKKYKLLSRIWIECVFLQSIWKVWATSTKKKNDVFRMCLPNLNRNECWFEKTALVIRIQKPEQQQLKRIVQIQTGTEWSSNIEYKK